jgi:hypothetical protein
MLNAIVAINPEAVNEARKEIKQINNDHQFTVCNTCKEIMQPFRACLPPQEHLLRKQYLLQMPLSLPEIKIKALW